MSCNAVHRSVSICVMLLSPKQHLVDGKRQNILRHSVVDTTLQGRIHSKGMP